MDYEIQIYSKDKTKIIRFKESENNPNPFQTQMAWEDYFYALGSVIDDTAEKFRENNTLVGRLDVKDISFDEVVDVMCEDLSVDMTKTLTEEKEISIYGLN